MNKIQYEIFNPKTYLPIFFYDTSFYGKIEQSNWHDFIELIFVKSGECTVICDQSFIKMNKGNVCIINSNCIHTAKSDTNVHMYNVGFNNDFCNYNGIKIQEYTFETKFNDINVTKMLNKLQKLFFSDPEHELYQAEINSMTLDLILYLIKNHTVKKQKEIYSQRNIYYSIGYIKANFNKKITVDDVCRQSGFSRSYFFREFKKITGNTVIDYINKLRCENACTFFKTKKYSVKDVFQFSCFENLPYFTKVFKKHIGMTPSEYLKAVKSLE